MNSGLVRKGTEAGDGVVEGRVHLDGIGNQVFDLK